MSDQCLHSWCHVLPWNHLTASLQVPQKIADACLSSSPTANSVAAFRVFRHFAEWATANKLSHAAAAAASQPAGHSRAALGDSLMQQLQEVELPQRVLSLMPALAKQLLAAHHSLL